MARDILSESERQTVILIAFMINEMATADDYESLSEATTIKPDILDTYARYSVAAVRAIEGYPPRATDRPCEVPDA